MTHSSIASLLASTFLVAVAMFVFTRTEFHTRLNFVILDQLFQYRGTRQPDPNLIIIGMDERSYETLSVPITAPWPRSLHTKLLHRLADDGVAKVVMDILFVDASADPLQDLDLANAISRVPTVLGAASGFGQHATLNGSFLLEELISPLELFNSRAAAIGLVGLPQNQGRVRNFLVERSELFPNVPSLAEAASGVPHDKGPDNRALINFYGPARTIPTVSYEMVVSDEHPLPKGTFTGKTVFVGLMLRGRTGPSQREAFVTPFDESTFGTELHATATSNLLKRDWIDRFSPRTETVAAVTVAIAVAIPIFTMSGLAAAFTLAFVAVLLAAWHFILFALGWFVPVGAALLVGPIFALLIRILANQRAPLSRRRPLLG